MESIGFCSFCGRILSKDFLYCPYCGTRCGAEECVDDILEHPFQMIETKVREHTLVRLSRLEKVLVNLERDLDDFLSRG